MEMNREKQRPPNNIGLGKGLLIILAGVIIVAGVVSALMRSNSNSNSIDSSGQPIALNDAVEQPKPTPAHVGSALFAENAEVTLLEIIDPAQSDSEYIKADAGKRYVAVKWKIENKGQDIIDDNANNNTTLMGSDGQAYKTSIGSVKGCTNFSYGGYKISSSSSVIGCVTFQLADSVKPTKVQFSPNSGFSDVNAEWLVP